MSDPNTQDPSTTEEPHTTPGTNEPISPNVDPDLPHENTTGEGSGDVEADTASGGAPER